MIYLKGRTGERQREKERGQRQREYSCLLAHYSDGHSDRAGEVAAVSREYLLGLSWVQGAHALVSSSRLAAGSWMKSGIGKTCTDSPMGYWSAQVVAFTHSAHWLHLCSWFIRPVYMFEGFVGFFFFFLDDFNFLIGRWNVSSIFWLIELKHIRPK